VQLVYWRLGHFFDVQSSPLCCPRRPVHRSTVRTITSGLCFRVKAGVALDLKPDTGTDERWMCVYLPIVLRN
jgi:hypothetical protein